MSRFICIVAYSTTEATFGAIQPTRKKAEAIARNAANGTTGKISVARLADVKEIARDPKDRNTE